MLSSADNPDNSQSLRTYRSRRNRPCDYCRKRKTRCDMVAPGLCAKCQKYGATCTFVDEPAKKRRSSGSKSFHKDDHDTHHSRGSFYGKLQSGESSSTVSDEEGSFSKQRPSTSSFLPTPSPPTGPKSFNSNGKEPYLESHEQPPSPIEEEEPSIPLVPPGMGGIALIGLSGDQDPNLLQYFQYDNTEAFSFIKSALRRVSADPDFPVQFLTFADERGSSYKTQTQAQLDKLRKIAGKYEERLLALYFRFIHPLYPIIDKHAFYTSYKEAPNSIDPGLLAGLMALSCWWWKYDAILCVNPMPAGLSTALYEECEISIQRDYKYPTITTIQALLLLLQRRLALDQTALTFSATADMAKLIALAHNLGLHLDCSSWSISPVLKKLRQKLWATIFVMEKWIAANAGRPSLLQWANSTWGVYKSDDPEEQLFVQLNKLTVILDIVCRELYSPRDHVLRVRDQAGTQARVTELLATLKSWYDDLPEDIKDMKQTRGRGEYCRNGTVHLAALTIEVLLFKIRLQPAAFTLNEYRYYRTQGAEVIQRVIKFTSEISHSHLTAYWYSTARLSFSTIAHFVFYYHATSLTTAEHRDTKEFIKKWLWALKILSQGWEEGTGLAKSRLETVFWQGDSLFSKDAPMPSDLNNKLTEPNHTGSSTPIAQSIASSAGTGNASVNNVLTTEYQPSPGMNFGADLGLDDMDQKDFMEVHTDWMNDDEMILLNEDIMPPEKQEEQLNHLLAEIEQGTGEKWDGFFCENLESNYL